MGEIEAQKSKLKTDTPVDASMLVRAFTGRLKPATRTAYLYSLNQFRAWCGIATLVELAEKICAMTGAEANLLILRYTESRSGRTPATINARVQGVRSLVRLARMLGLIT